MQMNSLNVCFRWLCFTYSECILYSEFEQVYLTVFLRLTTVQRKVCVYTVHHVWTCHWSCGVWMSRADKVSNERHFLVAFWEIWNRDPYKWILSPHISESAVWILMSYKSASQLHLRICSNLVQSIINLRVYKRKKKTLTCVFSALSWKQIHFSVVSNWSSVCLERLLLSTIHKDEQKEKNLY